MGRLDTSGKQYHQGIQLQESTDLDTPPHEADLYDPHPPPPPPPAPAAPHDHHNKMWQHDSDVIKPQAFPPQDTTQQFPPPAYEEEATQRFPPVSPEFAATHNFPPPNPQPFNAPQFQQSPFQASPAHLGVQMGTPPPAFNSNIPPQPPRLHPTQIQDPAWKTGLFGCMDNPSNAIITLLFPCVTFGQIAEILDSGRTSCGTSGMLYTLISCCIAMPCIMSCTYRSKLRSRFGLVESPAPDCLVHCFCECCALCQEYRELEVRGIDPSIGWLGNVAKLQKQQQQLFGMTPPMQQMML